MNIAQAKEQVKNTVKAYLTKDEYGAYKLDPQSQRPIVLIGAPGIGKTAIMSQIAHEMGLGLVSYSMTHHTRQSALGLPYITDETFGGQNYRVTHYTMSEIIGAVYELAETTGLSEGLLFLDEVNCVSETLAPAMLQFLQFKVFGQHSMPRGWVIVCAGNPPEYNNSVHEFDIVTWDRLKRIDVEPDYDAWVAYANDSGVHPAVKSYLELKKENFYKVETTARGKDFVTARGWVDMSRVIALYEENDIDVTPEFTLQYLQDLEISRDFANYYQIYRKYESDYQVARILEGEIPDDIIGRLVAASFTERLAVIEMVFSGCRTRAQEVYEGHRYLKALMDILLEIRDAHIQTPADRLVDAKITELRNKSSFAQRMRITDRSDERISERQLAFLVDVRSACLDNSDAYDVLKRAYGVEVETFKELIETMHVTLDNAFTFFEKAFGQGAEMVIFVTDLTASTSLSDFISNYGCKKYFEHNKELLFYERQNEIIAELEGLDL